MTASACRSMASALSGVGSCGRRWPTASFRSLQRSSATCWRRSIGGIRKERGDRVRQGDSSPTSFATERAESALLRSCPSRHSRMTSNVEALKRLVLVREADLADARARQSSSEALIAHLRLTIEKMRRDVYGQRSERGARLLD